MNKEKFEIATELADKMRDIDRCLQLSDWSMVATVIRTDYADDIIKEAAVKIRQRLNEFRGDYQKQFDEL